MRELKASRVVKAGVDNRFFYDKTQQKNNPVERANERICYGRFIG